ncbi:MAG: hypothetical protein JNM84_13750 [Planctomycetes bacterium]|nr:hypothetical protein [Planctomycetota bacterium]
MARSRSLVAAASLRALACAALAVIYPALASAQSIRVNPNGGAPFTDLQAAIDAAPHGATIRVQGGTWGPLVVRRSVRLIGEPTFEIFVQGQSLAGSGGIAQDRALTLLGSGQDELELSHCTIHGRVPGPLFAQCFPAISGGGFRSIRIVSSLIEAPRWQNVTGLAVGQPAISLAPGAHLWLADTAVVGGTSYDCCGSAFRFGPRGGAAIEASGCRVTALDSQIRGGDGLATYWSFFPPSNNACPCPANAPFDSRGGAGVVAEILLEANSSITGGLGGEVWFDPGFGFQPWGRQPDGPAADVTRRITWTDDVTVTYGRSLGGVVQLKDLSGLFSLVVMGLPATEPFELGGGEWVYVDVLGPVIAQGLPANGQISIAVPRDVNLIGAMLATHFAGPPPTALSRPLITAIRF